MSEVLNGILECIEILLKYGMLDSTYLNIVLTKVVCISNVVCLQYKVHIIWVDVGEIRKEGEASIENTPRRNQERDG